VAEGKAGADADVFKDVSNYEANGKEGEDAARPVKHCAVNQREDNWR